MRASQRGVVPSARRWLVAATVVVLVAGFVVAAVWGTGYERSRLLLSGGVAWLASPQGLVTLLDGTSELVLGSVAVPVSGTPEVVQVGSSALVVDAAAGTVTRVDGATYKVSSPVRFGGGETLQVFAGNAAAYVVDGAGRQAAVIDPVTLQVRRTVPLDATPGPGQSVVDRIGRLWVVDGGGGGGLFGFGDVGDRVRVALGDGAARLIVAGAQLALLDLTGRRVGPVTASSGVSSWSCLDIAGGPVRLLGSATNPLVYAAVSQTGELLVADLNSTECVAPVSVGRPGDEFGPLVEASGAVLVPNVTTGRTAVVDAESRSVVADLDVLPPGGRLELLAKDGLVFYNDLAGDQAGVIRFTGGQWLVGPSQRKFGSDELLTPADAEIAAQDAAVGLPPPPGQTGPRQTAPTQAGPAQPAPRAPPPAAPAPIAPEPPLPEQPHCSPACPPEPPPACPTPPSPSCPPGDFSPPSGCPPYVPSTCPTPNPVPPGPGDVIQAPSTTQEPGSLIQAPT